MNNQGKNKNYKNQLTRRMALQCMLALVGFIVGFLLLVFIAWQFVSMFTWQSYDPLYIMLSFVKEYIILFTGIPIIIGWACITYHFMGRPLRYLDDIISASETLANPTDKQIILPEAMKNVQDELNQVRLSALRNAKAAKDAEQRKNDLIVYLAHDLKTPLTSVIGYLTLLNDEPLISPELRGKYTSIALNKAERLEGLINEFFDITRFSLSNIMLEYSRVNLSRMLEQILYEFKPMFEEKNLEYKLIAGSDIMIRCDVDKMQRVFDNLLRNAVNYSFENSEVNILVTQSNNILKINFINHGNTIPKEKLERIFEQFYRIDSSRTTRSGGAGLGLAIAQEIVELHNGTIKARSEDEVIEFEVTIPLS